MKLSRIFGLTFTTERFIILLGIIALSIYTILRAVFVSMTHDEAFTILNYVITPANKASDIGCINNHLLNTMLTRLSYHTFGGADWVFRLPNVLAGILFFCCTGMLALRLPVAAWHRIFIFFFVATNTLIFGFFSLCRGYGISIGLLSLTIYWFYRYAETKRWFPFLPLSMIVLALACLANYSLANLLLLFMLVSATEALRWLIRTKGLRNKLRVFFIALLSFLPAIGGALGIGWLLFEFNKSNNFYVGGQGGFWSDTAYTASYLSNEFYGNTHGRFTPALTAFAGLMFLIAVVSIIILLRRKISGASFFSGAYFIFILSACAGILELQHHLYHIPYSIDRATLHFVLLFCWALAFISAAFPEKMRRYYLFAFGAFAFFPISSFFLGMNLSKTSVWKTNEGMRDAVEVMMRVSKQDVSPGQMLSSSASFDECLVFNYYLWLYDCNWVSPVDMLAAGFKTKRDYSFQSTLDEGALGSLLPVIWNNSHLRLLRNFHVSKPATDTMSKNNFELTETSFRVEGKTRGYAMRLDSNRTFIAPIGDTIRDSLPEGTGFFTGAWFRTSKADNAVFFTIGVNRDGKAVFWERVSLFALCRVRSDWTLVQHGFAIPFALLPGDEITSYITSEGAYPVYTDDFFLIRENRTESD